MAQARLPIYDSGAVRMQSIFEFKELFRYRFLIRNLVSRDLKVRYKRSSLGFIWVMLNPLLMMAVITIVFAQLLKFTVNHYPVYVLSGLLLWNMFSQGSVAAMSSLRGSSGILSKMYVPPSVFVSSAIGSALVNLAFAVVPFCVLAVVTGVSPNPAWAFILVPGIEVTLFTFGIGLVVAALFIFFSDIYEIYSVLLMVFMYLTPVMYPVKILPSWLIPLEQYNPMFIFMDSFRTAVIAGQIPPMAQLVSSAVWALATFAVGWTTFTALEAKFANHL